MSLIDCPHCNKAVVPTVNPHDTISQYCPLCNRPITNLEGRKGFLIAAAVFALAVVAGLSAIIYLVWSMTAEITATL
jgi:hypothetical protein